LVSGRSPASVAGTSRSWPRRITARVRRPTRLHRPGDDDRRQLATHRVFAAAASLLRFPEQLNRVGRDACLRVVAIDAADGMGHFIFQSRGSWAN